MRPFLSHIRILDLTRLLPGAYCTQLLADLGAQVVKVEEPGRGDYLRQLNPWSFGAMNRNKSSVTLNIRHARGREILLQLVQGYDVLVESFRPGVMERLDLQYERLKQVNGGIVYCSLSGYGQDGPYRLRSGHDINYLAAAGVLGLTAERGEMPISLPLPLADLAGSLFASHAILAALLAREASGQGCYVDVAMTDASLSFMSPRVAVAAGKGKAGRGDLIRRGAYDVYQTRDGRHLALGVIEDKFWANLLRVLERGDLAEDPRFQEDASRTLHHQDVRAIIEPLLTGRDLAEWMAMFEEVDVPASPVLCLDEVEADPQVQHRGLIFDLPDETGRQCKQVGYPARFPGQRGGEDRPAPSLGRDTTSVLGSLGFSAEEMESFKEEGII